MGVAKNQYLEYYDKGFSKPPENFVCNNHFTDYAIVRHININSGGSAEKLYLN